jgi:diacylglycerol O-acyltransferase / wax synthase
MARRPAYHPLSAQDRAFLWFEDASAHMHLGGIALFESAPLLGPTGGIDIERIRAHIASRLHLVPRYRQRLGWIPLVNRPVWVDDEHFNLAYHVRHTAVPRPGDDAQLKDLASRILSQQLYRGKPLWELYIVEGLEGGRFAILVKTHHALADGISAFDLFSALLAAAPTDRVDAPAPWRPAPAPSAWTMLRDQALFYAQAPLALGQGLVEALAEPAQFPARVAEGTRAVWELVRAGLPRPTPTPLEGPLGPHRRFDWLALDLEAVKAVKNRFGGTVNDVVLAVVAGAVRRFLRHRGMDARGVQYRVVVPVSVRSEAERGAISNRVSGWLLTLPLDEADARRRLAIVRATTAQVRESKQALGPQVLQRAVEYAMPAFLQLGVRLTAHLHAFNLIVTNVPGPPEPLYLLGARLLGGYPQVPLFENQGLGVALFSYCGTLYWGFNADWDRVPDLPAFVDAVAHSLAELTEAAGAARTRPASAAR